MGPAQMAVAHTSNKTNSENPEKCLERVKNEESDMEGTPIGRLGEVDVINSCY
jgi:hypothetical protein